MKYLIFLSVLFMILLAACNPAAPAATSIPTATDTPNLVQTRIAAIPKTNTPTVIPTHTVRPTALPPTPTETPIPIRDFLTVISKELNYDLVWVEEGTIYRLDTKKREIIQWVGRSDKAIIGVEYPVVDYQYSSTGILVVVMEKENSLILQRFDLYEDSGQEFHPLEITINSTNYSISPNGDWVSFNSKNIISVEELSGRLNRYSEVYMIHLVDGEVRRLGFCIDSYSFTDEVTIMDSCNYPASWSPDSKTLIWRGDDGLYLSKVNGGTNFILADGIGQYWEDNYFYIPGEWSPDGRYLLIEKALWEGGFYVVFDSQNLRFTQVEYTDQSYGSGSFIMQWLADSRLTVVWTPDWFDSSSKLFVYRTSGSGSVILQSIYENDITYHDGMLECITIFPNHDTSENFKFMALSAGYPYYTILTFDLSSFEIISYEEIPLENKGILPHYAIWTPDGNWLLMAQDEYSTASLMNISDAIGYHLENIITGPSCCFTWIEHEE